jgi:uncharacterized Zn finger protein (UPF0148 family)
VKGEGDKCGCCKKMKLRLVNGALVCPICDHVNEWPNVKRATG